MERTRPETVVALSLIGGGALGASLFIYLAIANVMAGSPGVSILTIPIILLFAWSCFVGIRLWQATAFGRRWGLWLCASQVLVIGLPFLAFDWFTGVTLSPQVTIGDGISMNVNIQAGASANYFIGLRDGPVVIGINVFAIWATWVMFRRVYAIRRIDMQDSE